MEEGGDGGHTVDVRAVQPSATGMLFSGFYFKIFNFALCSGKNQTVFKVRTSEIGCSTFRSEDLRLFQWILQWSFTVLHNTNEPSELSPQSSFMCCLTRLSVIFMAAAEFCFERAGWPPAVLSDHPEEEKGKRKP